MLRFGSVHQDSPTSVKGDRIPGHSTTPPKSSQTLVPEVREMPQVSKCNPYRTRVILLRPISCLAEVLGPCSGFSGQGSVWQAVPKGYPCLLF